MSPECLFCKIVAGEIPSRKVYEDDDIYVFLDIFPANVGHSLVIPKAHHTDIFDIPADLYSKVAAKAKSVAELLQSKLNAEGVTILQANKEAGWQTVFHLHMHVIPRFKNDALHKPWDIQAASDETLAKTHELLLG